MRISKLAVGGLVAAALLIGAVTIGLPAASLLQGGEDEPQNGDPGASDDPSGSAAADQQDAGRLATVEVTDLVEELTLSGQLTHGAPVALVAGRSGTVTWLPQPGEVIGRGEIVVMIDDQPTALLTGDLPLYRSLGSGDVGEDVRQVEGHLAAMGYDVDQEMDVDDRFTAVTGRLVRDLQADLDMDETGEVGPEDFVVTRGAVLVTDRVAQEGQPITAGMPILEVVPIVAQSIVSGGSRSGTVTELVEVGAEPQTGDVLMAVDGEPVVAIVGSSPFSRDLSEGDRGSDVRQLRQALSDLGFLIGDIGIGGNRFDEETRAALAEWERQLGLDDDGILQTDQAIAIPSGSKVSQTFLTGGQELVVSSALFEAVIGTGSVSAELPVDDRALVAWGDEVTVTLPNGDRTAGLVTDIGVRAREPGGDLDSYFDLEVALLDPDVSDGIIDAPVDVDVVKAVSEGVLVVPSGALVALQEGGFAVELADGSLVAVETGTFTDGRVVVTGDVQEGQQVVVAR